MQHINTFHDFIHVQLDKEHLVTQQITSPIRPTTSYTMNTNLLFSNYHSKQE